MPQVDIRQIQITLTVQQAAEVEGVTRREIYNRLRPGDAHEVTWAYAANDQPGPKRRRVIDGGSLAPGAGQAREQVLRKVAWERMRKSAFFQNGNDKAEAFRLEARSAATSMNPKAQGELYLSTEAQAVDARYDQQRGIDKWLPIIKVIDNGNYATEINPETGLSFQSKAEYRQVKAAELTRQWGHRISLRTLERKLTHYRQRGAAGLIDRPPGPSKSGPRIETWAKAQIEVDRRQGFTFERCYARLTEEINRRQEYWPERAYAIPSHASAREFFKSLLPPQGRSEVKAMAMQIHRTYADCYALDRTDNDEWIIDVETFDPHRLLYTDGERRGQVRTTRWNYLLTMFDERSMYPLDAVTVELSRSKGQKKPAASESKMQEAELDLLTSVCLNYGVPGLVNTDHGRFSSAHNEAILKRLGIGRNTPRGEHNPQGLRLERFHTELARFARNLPGWVGSNPEERDEKSNIHIERPLHELWVRGKPGPDGKRLARSPLLSQAELCARIQGFFAHYREENYSEGTDMHGLTPAIVFRREAPPAGFRQIAPEVLARMTARVYPEILVQTGGHLRIPEGKYQYTIYYSHELALPWIQSRKCTVERPRFDHSFVWVSFPGSSEKEIIAPVMPSVGVSSSEHLGQAMAEKQFSKKLLECAMAGSTGIPPVSHGQAPGQNLVSPSRATPTPSSRERIDPEDFFSNLKPRAKVGPPIDAAQFVAGQPEAEAPAPGLYELSDCTVEE